MVIEKAAALREAEKFLRTGNIARAIDGYEQIVDADADDWKTRSLLAQLHARAGAPEKAAEHLVSAADILHLAGDTATAESLYSKILAIDPHHEHALSQLEEIRGARQAAPVAAVSAPPFEVVSFAGSIAPDTAGTSAAPPVPFVRPRPAAPTPPPAEPAPRQEPVAPVEPVEPELFEPAASFWSRTRVMAAVIALAVVGSGVFAGWRYFVPSAAAASTGTLTVTTNPAGLDLVIDGQARGRTPFQGQLSPGAHVLVITHGNDRRSIPVTITAGSEVSQFIELAASTPQYGQLQIVSEPAGASVSVDGQHRGTAPLTLIDLAPGEHTVTLDSVSGTVTQRVTVAAGATASLVVPMSTPPGVPVSGWIAIASPVDLQIFENQRLLGSSRTDRIMVAVGRHDLQLANDALGFRVSRSVQVAPGQVAAVRIELPKGSLAVNAQPWAEVLIDGEHVGETPIGNVTLTIGPHEVVFRHPEFGERRHTATITLDSPARLSVDMRKK